MVSTKEVERQLKSIGFDFRLWGRGEVKELNRVLSDEETIQQCVNGHYKGGFAMLVATNRRLLLIDRKPLFLTIEALWYDKIGQVDYNHRLANATLCVSSPNKDLQFTTWNHPRLRAILLYSQEKLIEARQGVTPNIPQIATAPQTYQAIPAAPAVILQPMSIREDTDLYDGSGQLRSLLTQHSAKRFPALDLPEKLTLYTATRLPFSHRRYFTPRAIQGQEA